MDDERRRKLDEDLLAVDEELLQTKRTRLEAERAALAQSSLAAANIVRLNVGGRHFDTTLDTLATEPASIFAGISITESRSVLAMPGVLIDGDGRFFFDRDPVLFNMLLQGLRTRQAPRVSDATRTELLSEAEHYRFTRLKHMLIDECESCGIDSSVDCTVAKKMTEALCSESDPCRSPAALHAGFDNGAGVFFGGAGAHYHLVRARGAAPMVSALNHSRLSQAGASAAATNAQPQEPTSSQHASADVDGKRKRSLELPPPLSQTRPRRSSAMSGVDRYAAGPAPPPHVAHEAARMAEALHAIPLQTNDWVNQQRGPQSWADADVTTPMAGLTPQKVTPPPPPPPLPPPPPPPPAPPSLPPASQLPPLSPHLQPSPLLTSVVPICRRSGAQLQASTQALCRS